MLNASFHSSIGTSPCKIVFGGAVDMDRCLVPQKVSGGAKAVIGGITDKKRQMVVSDYISHLAAVQKGIAELWTNTSTVCCRNVWRRHQSPQLSSSMDNGLE